MLREKSAIRPISNPSETPTGFYSPGRSLQPQPLAGREKKDDPSERMLVESALDELELQIHKPLRLSTIEIRRIVTRSVMMLSAMSSELGVALRIRIRGQSLPVSADVENVRRSINALIIYLLTLSQSQGCVTVSVEDRIENGKRGMSIGLSANNVVVPWKPNPVAEDGFVEPQEISICRRLLEKNGGTLAVQSEEEQGLVMIVWIPLKGANRK
jgi:hypothetical protein